MGPLSHLGPCSKAVRNGLTAVALIYLFGGSWQLLVVSLEVAAAVSSQQMGEPSAGVGGQEPHEQGC